ncbi:MAG: hypothetical protein A2729_01365 [Candidatus Buchananbacteria bacterium RIFCSPHIGHO2_01_FULL_39_14]|uniref:Transcription elongation factor GreA/GreB C-terminal domain-containing protein n=2 Tax=Candidatus Buchananiibacteriota TaxID=1817903 RepID=A0A1G1YU25_9BACT|nr:MAG: hypothetical protein A2729_01365 [Candidatus Buchananbacteria bacterium RIFCSPHIGHO2_01_FULL_39_14]OGY49213.1 MAG: hypothetical protein A3D39_00390 [Candidatus Buchananbacteria bacterium RIFCSPHIGHO2_02_FULL_39_17]OGY55861.1 MAG: hypothetical protein A2912_02655 [Candidatus Buchananbacteria bacterium RIFCSPLOWO2_01_FULL_40_23b]
MENKLLFTKRGYNKLKRKIDELTKKLNDLQAQTAHAAEVGGNQYHDNASYEMLVIEIRGIDHRLSEAHNILNRAVIIASPKNTDQVVIGTQVTILRNGKQAVWEIAGYGESDPDSRLLAYNTPLASLLIGKHKGDCTEGQIAGKQVKIKILEIALGVKNEDEK